MYDVWADSEDAVQCNTTTRLAVTLLSYIHMDIPEKRFFATNPSEWSLECGFSPQSSETSYYRAANRGR